MTYPEPSVLLVDLKPEAAKALTNKGYAVEEGSYGFPYKCEKQVLAPLMWVAHMPSLQEKDIVFIDMTTPEVHNRPDGEPIYMNDQHYIGDPEPHGVVDPRGFHMCVHASSADKALDGGAVFIFFLHHETQSKYLTRSEHFQPLPLNLGPQLPLGVFQNRRVVFNNEHGKFIKILHEDGSLTNALRKRLKGSEFFSTFEVLYPHAEAFVPVATNKSGEFVAGVLTELGSEKKGMVFLIPQIPDKVGFLVEMMEDVLPTVRPDLFPYVAKPHWREDGEYDLPIVSDMRRDIQMIKDEANEKIAKINRMIEEERGSTTYLLDLLTGNDDLLVNAVKKTLESFGFQPVDSDEELARIDSNRKRMEDLHIDEPGLPILLVESKGVSHKVSDEDALAVEKYLRPRMREWNRLDIIGLSVVNQQRGMPPLDRDNETPFRPLILENADHHEIGLMTSFDLYRLGRSYITQGWKSEDVKPLFYRKGRIHPMPTHYHLLGAIEGYSRKSKAIGIKIDEGTLKTGDRIAFELPLEFVEQDVESLQVDGKPVEQAEACMIAGVLTGFGKVEMKKGVRVYLVRR